MDIPLQWARAYTITRRLENASKRSTQTGCGLWRRATSTPQPTTGLKKCWQSHPRMPRCTITSASMSSRPSSREGLLRCQTWPPPRSGRSPWHRSHRVSVTGSMAALCYHSKTACVCVFNRSSLGTECVGYETKASNETRRMAHAARGCPTRSVPAGLRPGDGHADRAVHPRPFGYYRRSRDPSPAPMSLAVPADDVAAAKR